eukprot:635867-Pyramimonas_sp.AAC.1
MLGCIVRSTAARAPLRTRARIAQLPRCRIIQFCVALAVVHGSRWAPANIPARVRFSLRDRAFCAVESGARRDLHALPFSREAAPMRPPAFPPPAAPRPMRMASPHGKIP